MGFPSVGCTDNGSAGGQLIGKQNTENGYHSKERRDSLCGLWLDVQEMSESDRDWQYHYPEKEKGRDVRQIGYVCPCKVINHACRL